MNNEDDRPQESPDPTNPSEQPAPNPEIISKAEADAAKLNERVRADMTLDQLLAKARLFVRRSNETAAALLEWYWMLGEALELINPLTPDGEWRRTLKSLNLNHESAGQARAIHRDIPFEDLPKYKNKTRALRAIGRLADPDQSKKDVPTTVEPELANPGPSIPSGDDRPSHSKPLGKGDVGHTDRRQVPEPTPPSSQATTTTATGGVHESEQGATSLPSGGDSLNEGRNDSEHDGGVLDGDIGDYGEAKAKAIRETTGPRWFDGQPSGDLGRSYAWQVLTAGEVVRVVWAPVASETDRHVVTTTGVRLAREEGIYRTRRDALLGASALLSEDVERLKADLDDATRSLTKVLDLLGDD